MNEFELRGNCIDVCSSSSAEVNGSLEDRSPLLDPVVAPLWTALENDVSSVEPMTRLSLPVLKRITDVGLGGLWLDEATDKPCSALGTPLLGLFTEELGRLCGFSFRVKADVENIGNRESVE